MKKVLTGRKLFDIIKRSLRCLKKKKTFLKKVKKVLDKLESVRYNIKAVTKTATKNLDN